MARFSTSILLSVLVCSSLNISVLLGQETDKRICVVEKAKSYVGVRELTGKNDGVEVEYFLNSVGLGKGYAWCVAFLASVYTDCNVPNPKSAWSPNWGLDKDVIWRQGQSINAAMSVARMGDVFTMYFNSKGRIAHGAMIYYMTPVKVITIEGNTNDAGSRDGDGVYIKTRRWDQIYRITSYL
jgi:hypothetical protein